MPDLGPFAGALASLLGPLVGEALKSFVRTTLGMLCLGLATAALSYWVAADGSALRGALAALLALVLCAALGVVLAGKRALGRALLVGITRFGLGARASDLLFAQLLGVDASAKMGERGGSVARTVEGKLPLAQAERLLRGTVEGLVRAEPAGGGLRGWLRRKIQASLLGKIEKVTLSRFRDAETREGGVDLMRVRDDLAGRVDSMLSDKAQGALNRLTFIFAVGACAASVALAAGIRELPI